MNIDQTVIIVSGISTLAVFSFLIKENVIYRLFEHLFIGIASGFAIILGLKSFIWPIIIKPMLGLDIITYPDGSSSAEYNPLLLLYLIPLCFGLLYYFIFSSKYSWLAKLVIGFSLGASGGIAFKGIFNRLIPQITGSFKPLVVFENNHLQILASLENIFFIGTLLIVMYYFFFSFKFKSEHGRVDSLARCLLMVCFGAFFGSTVMARLSLLVERVEFLYRDFLGVFF